mmetsp:Transcript_4722/g.11211  ORF Transcript_4722/g.11211 Transcript_4722/m.11211 type:complete len:356 (-) Transcript_4722:123-1190(-)
MNAVVLLDEGPRRIARGFSSQGIGRLHTARIIQLSARARGIVVRCVRGVVVIETTLAIAGSIVLRLEVERVVLGLVRHTLARVRSSLHGAGLVVWQTTSHLLDILLGFLRACSRDLFVLDFPILLDGDLGSICHNALGGVDRHLVHPSLELVKKHGHGLRLLGSCCLLHVLQGLDELWGGSVGKLFADLCARRCPHEVHGVLNNPIPIRIIGSDLLAVVLRLNGFTEVFSKLGMEAIKCSLHFRSKITLCDDGAVRHHAFPTTIVHVFVLQVLDACVQGVLEEAGQSFMVVLHGLLDRVLGDHATHHHHATAAATTASGLTTLSVRGGGKWAETSRSRGVTRREHQRWHLMRREH